MPLRRPRFAVESLEARATPAVFASVSSGVLSVSGFATTPGDQIRVVETAYNAGTKTGTFQVFDGATQVGGNFSVTRDVLIQLTAADDNVQVDLNGFKAPAAITTTLGNGNNTYNLVDAGTVTGLVNVSAGTGNDTFTLGDGGTLTLSGVNLNPGTGTDTATISGGVTTGSVAANAAETLNLNAGSTIGGNISTTGSVSVNIPNGATVNGSATFGMASGPNDVTLGGLVKGTLTVNGATFSNINTIDLNVTSTGSVLGHLFLNAGAYNIYGFVTLDVAGNVSGQVTVTGGGGSDLINVTGNIGVALNARLAGGNDIVTVSGTVGTAGQKFYSINLDMGTGDDTVDLSGSTLKGGLLVILGDGDDSFQMTSANASQEASPYRFFLDAGAGTDSFIDTSGVFTKTGPNSAVVKILNFETP